MKIALIVGHEKKSKGAFSKTLGQAEYDWNTELANMARNYATMIGAEVQIFFRDVVGIAGAYKKALAWKPDALIELHFNAADGKASGTETLYNDAGDAKDVHEVIFAKKVNDAMVKALGLKDRGIKKRQPGDRGYGNINQTKSVPSILIESGFGDNPKDAKAMAANKNKLAKALINGTVDFLKEFV